MPLLECRDVSIRRVAKQLEKTPLADDFDVAGLCGLGLQFVGFD